MIFGIEEEEEEEEDLRVMKKPSSPAQLCPLSIFFSSKNPTRSIHFVLP